MSTRADVRDFLAERLTEIAQLLPPDRYKLTLVARCVDPEFAPPKNADITIGDDDIDDAIAALERLKAFEVIP